MHVDEDFAQRAVLVLAGMDIDLVAADARFLDIALAAVGQLGPHAVALDDLLDDARRGVLRRGLDHPPRRLLELGDVEVEAGRWLAAADRQRTQALGRGIGVKLHGVGYALVPVQREGRGRR